MTGGENLRPTGQDAAPSQVRSLVTPNAVRPTGQPASVPRQRRPGRSGSQPVDVLVVGGGLGGVAAALAALRRGRSVVLTEETDWLGGQLTGQGVPPDEHPWIEQFGGTRSLPRAARGDPGLLPHLLPAHPRGRGRQRAQPRAGPGEPALPRAAGRRVGARGACWGPIWAGRPADDLVRAPAGVGRDGRRPGAVGRCFEGPDGRPRRGERAVRPRRDRAGRPAAAGRGRARHRRRVPAPTPASRSAAAHAQPDNMQAFTWGFAVEHRAGEDHTIDRPDEYGFWRDYRPTFWPDRLLSLVAPDRALSSRCRVPSYRTGRAGRSWPTRGATRATRTCGGSGASWPATLFEPGFAASDVTLVNWPRSTTGSVR